MAGSAPGHDEATALFPKATLPRVITPDGF